MANDNEDTPVCRYCLDGGGPLISPCSCRGSVSTVHESCFRSWYRIQLEQQVALACPICKSLYRPEFCPDYETIPSKNTVASFLLYNPYILNLFVYYGWIIRSAILNRDGFYYSDPIYIQVTIHALYFATFLSSFRVKNLWLYARTSAVYYQLLISVKLFLWIYALGGEPLANSVAVLSLSAYWRIHIHTLESINATLTGR